MNQSISELIFYKNEKLFFDFKIFENVEYLSDNAPNQRK